MNSNRIPIDKPGWLHREIDDAASLALLFFFMFGCLFARSPNDADARTSPALSAAWRAVYSLSRNSRDSGHGIRCARLLSVSEIIPVIPAGGRSYADLRNKMIGAHNECGKDHDDKHDRGQKGVEGQDSEEAKPCIPDPADSHEGPDVQIVSGKQQHKQGEK